MRKGGLLFLTTIFSLSFVSADSVTQAIQGVGDVLDYVRQLADVLLNVISKVLFSATFDSELIYTKMMFFFILLIAIYLILNKNKIFTKKRGLNFLFALIISTLSVRYLPNTLIDGVRVPYGALAVAIFVFIPFIIFFFFLHNNKHFKHFGRRAGWGIFAVVFIVLWLSDPNRLAAVGETRSIVNWIYGIGIGLVVLAFIFDKKIHEYFAFSDFRRMSGDSDRQLRSQISVTIAEMRRDLRKYETLGMHDAADDMKDRIERMEERLRKTYR